jgi:hypothetical protein
VEHRILALRRMAVVDVQGGDSSARTGVQPSRNLEETFVLSLCPSVDVRIQRYSIPGLASGTGNIEGLCHDTLR